MEKIKTFRKFCYHCQCIISWRTLERDDINKKFLCRHRMSTSPIINAIKEECTFISPKGKIRKKSVRDIVHLAFLLRFLKKHGFKKINKRRSK